MNRYRLVAVTPSGYFPKEAFEAADLCAAAALHVAAFKNRRSPYALVMRGPDGRRYSLADSQRMASTPKQTEEA